MGKAREVHIQLTCGDIVTVATWRHTSTMPLAIGQKIEVWDCVAGHSNFHNSMALHVNSFPQNMVSKSMCTFIHSVEFMVRGFASRLHNVLGVLSSVECTFEFASS